MQKPVELNIGRTPLACNVGALRYTAFDTSYNVMDDMTFFGKYFLIHLRDAFPIENLSTTSYGVFEAYLADPGRNPYNKLEINGNVLDLTQLEAQVLARRLAQVLNPYWLVDNHFASAANGFDGRTKLSSYTNFSFSDMQSSTVTSPSAQHILRRNDSWFVLLCVSTVSMVLASIVCMALTLVRLVPDATVFLSALTLNAAGSSLPDCSSHLNGDERVRALRDTRMVIGDMQPNQSIGRVGIGEEGNMSTLKKGRLHS